MSKYGSNLGENCVIYRRGLYLSNVNYFSKQLVYQNKQKMYSKVKSTKTWYNIHVMLRGNTDTIWNDSTE